jgi:hypothetical protein
MVTELLRCVVAALAATVTVTLPLPVPLLPFVMVSQLVPLAAVQSHPLPAVTATVVDSPAAGDVRELGAIEYAHGSVAPACVTLNVWPAIVTEPVRCDVDVLVATVTVTLALPVPLAPLVIASQFLLLDAVHVHPLSAATATTVDSPDAGDECVVGEMEYVHGGATPACVTLNVCPAIVTEPVRCDVDVLAATVTVTSPSPVPLAPFVIVSQLVPLAAVQSHPLPAVTATVVDSPAATDVNVDAEIE